MLDFTLENISAEDVERVFILPRWARDRSD
jgi:hypothetical protein